MRFVDVGLELDGIGFLDKMPNEVITSECCFCLSGCVVNSG